MPAKTVEQQIAKIDKDHGKARELLEREREHARENEESARAAVEGLEAELEGLEQKRPSLAGEVFRGEKEYAVLDELDSEMARLRRHLEVAQLAAGQAAARVPGI